ncbi:MAG: hypothetical protein AVDCRST_MAG66-4850, partial [uncultured Pseudonocardia sp.]
PTRPGWPGRCGRTRPAPRRCWSSSATSCGPPPTGMGRA